MTYSVVPVDHFEALKVACLRAYFSPLATFLMENRNFQQYHLGIPPIATRMAPLCVSILLISTCLGRTLKKKSKSDLHHPQR